VRRGPLAIGCGAGPSLRAGGVALRLRVTGSVEQLDAGRPLRARPCGAAVALPAGPLTVRAAAAPWRLDHVRLSSPAPAPAGAPAGGGRVLDEGADGRGSRDGVRLSVAGPSWLVLGESYDAGWRARCDGRSLGRPVPIQGFANGWPVDRGCRRASFAFAPNRALLAGDAISLVACLVLLALLIARRPRPVAAVLERLTPGPARPWPARRALVAAVVVGAALGFVFALRAGAVLAPLTFVVLWRGVSARTLALAAGAVLLVAVPVAHFAAGLPGEGYDTGYAVARIAEHWLAVGAVCALGGALVRTLAPWPWRRRRS
jgi:arabinofuranan 3-O-arabinosyltransferase